MEVLNFRAEGLASAAWKGVCVWTAGGVEGEDDASIVRSPAPRWLGIVPGCGCVGGTPEEGEVEHCFRELVDEAPAAVLRQLFRSFGELGGKIGSLGSRYELIISLETSEPAIKFFEVQLLVWAFRYTRIRCRSYSVDHATDRATPGPT